MSKRSKSKDSIRPEDVVLPDELVHQMAGSGRSNPGSAGAGRSPVTESSLATVPELDETIDTRRHAGPVSEIPGTLRGMEAREKRATSRDDNAGAVSIPRFAANTSPFPLARNKPHTKRQEQGRSDLEKELIAPTHLRVVQPREAAPEEATPSRSRIRTRTRPAADIRPPELAPAPATPVPVVRGPEVQGPDVLRPEGRAVPESEKVLTEDDSAQLFEVMNAVDLSDCPPEQSSMDLAPQAALDAINKGSWIRLTSRDGEVSMFKVAWINQQRTLALLVRFPDRRALSLRFSDMLKRLEEGHAALMSLPEA